MLSPSNRPHRHIAVVQGELDLQTLRARALQSERARSHGSSDWEEAIGIWQTLVRGESSVLDCFESDRRLYIVLKPNARSLELDDLTARESEVLLCAAAGESRKVTGYRLGLSRSYVSTLASSAMRKLGVRTQAQLVLLMRSFRQGTRTT